jgi:alkylation response protein AidB-like acyl-CoA dehydrogenase
MPCPKRIWQRRVRDADARGAAGWRVGPLGRKLWITNGNEAGCSSSSRTSNRRGLPRHHGLSGRTRLTWFYGRQEGRQAGHPRQQHCELLFDGCRVPAANVLGDVGKGYKIAIETLNEGRIAIGAQMIGLAQGALDHATAYTKERKQLASDRRFPGGAASTGARRDRGARRTADGVRSGAIARWRQAVSHRSRHGEALLV